MPYKEPLYECPEFSLFVELVDVGPAWAPFIHMDVRKFNKSVLKNIRKVYRAALKNFGRLYILEDAEEAPLNFKFIPLATGMKPGLRVHTRKKTHKPLVIWSESWAEA